MVDWDTDRHIFEQVIKQVANFDSVLDGSRIAKFTFSNILGNDFHTESSNNYASDLVFSFLCMSNTEKSKSTGPQSIDLWMERIKFAFELHPQINVQICCFWSLSGQINIIHIICKIM